jgi:hypothetical protein
LLAKIKTSRVGKEDSGDKDTHGTEGHGEPELGTGVEVVLWKRKGLEEGEM